MDYFDADVAYLTGLILARGQLIEQGDDRRIIIEFPASALTVEGIDTSYDQSIETKLGLVDIAFRLRNLLETDVDILSSGQEGYYLLVRFMRPNMIWRNLRLILGEATLFGAFRVLQILFDLSSG